MYSYQYHISDFNNATRHCTRVERSVYRDLMDLYYDKEAPLPADFKRLARLAMCYTDDELEALQTVLDEFFTLDGDAYHHQRIDSEIEKYRERADKARENGSKGGRPRKPNENPVGFSENPAGSEPVSVENPEETKSKANLEPITNNDNKTLTSDSGEPDLPEANQDYLEFANFMWSRVQSLTKQQKPPNMKRWTNDLRLLVEQDGRTKQDIYEVFVWANQDNFWRANILSPGKLREKFPQLYAKWSERHATHQRDNPSRAERSRHEAMYGEF